MSKYFLLKLFIYGLSVITLCADDDVEINISVGEKIPPKQMQELEAYKIPGIVREASINPRIGKTEVVTTRSFRVEDLGIVLIVTFADEDQVTKICWSKLPEIDNIMESSWFESKKISFTKKHFKFYTDDYKSSDK